MKTLYEDAAVIFHHYHSIILIAEIPTALMQDFLYILEQAMTSSSLMLNPVAAGRTTLAARGVSSIIRSAFGNYLG